MSKKKTRMSFFRIRLYQKDDFCDRISVHNDNNKRGLEGINNERFIVAEKDSRYDLAPFFKKDPNISLPNMIFQYFVRFISKSNA